MAKGKATQIVVYKPPVRKLKKKTKVAKKKKNSSSRPSNAMLSDPSVSSYLAALSNPFSDRAGGARVPDQFSAHTTTFELRASHTITASALGNVGVWVMPNVVTAMVVPDGTFPGSQTITWLNNTSANPSCSRWGFDRDTLGSRLQNYRIVGMGVRVANMSSMTNSSGKIIMGSYPINAYYVTKDFALGGTTPATNTSATGANTCSKWGILNSAGVIDYASLVNYPGTKVVSGLEAAEHEFDVIPKPCQPSAFEFREPNDSYQGYGFFGYISGSLAAGDPSYLKLDGFEACFIALTGGVASTTALDIEIVYHIEGAPQIGAGNASNNFVNQQGSQSPTNMSGFFSAVEYALKLPTVRQATHVAADMVHPLLGKFARAVY